MSTKPQTTTACVSWRDNDIPVSARFDDAYFAFADGLAETLEVFLDGNQLRVRWHQGQARRVAELGFGSGLNFLATLHAWNAFRTEVGLDAADRLQFTSFELFPMAPEDMARALATWPVLADLADALVCGLASAATAEPGSVLNVAFSHADLSLYLGDARDRLATWDGPADAWYLDGFSPAKNPELWDEALLATVYAKTAPGGTFSTYTAAGWVRRNLSAAGFEVSRVAGFGQKRERLQGRKSV